LYFAADGGLRLSARTASAEDGKKVQAKFLELVAKHIPAEGAKPAPKSDSPPDESPVRAVQGETRPAPSVEASAFGDSLTVFLRKEMAGDQKKWNGVVIERGYFDSANRYALRGVVESSAQNDELGKLLDALKGDPKWADYLTPAPAPPKLDVVPLSELLERVQRVAPAYAAFDGVRIESAQYDADLNLIFKATVVGKLGAEPAQLLAKLIREDARYKRRAPKEKQVKVEQAGGADRQDGPFDMAAGAKLLADGDKKAKDWLASARLHFPNESGVWFLSAYYHHTQGDPELARRDLFRVIELEGPVAFDGSTQRKRRYAAAKDLQGKTRNELESLWADYVREAKDGAKPITLSKDKK
ncbi:MAG: hypothetical protein K2V38_15905, partial [Gemmataceae bacterium]|nr:hypothetical protein [Gemmataceae bacterium]